MLISLLVPPSQAITINTTSETDLGIVKSGSSLTFDLQADDYAATSVSKITWSVKLNSTFNPGFSLTAKNGKSTKLTVRSVKALKNLTGRTFSVTVTVRDTDSSTNSITFTGKVMDAPVIRTISLPKGQAGSGKTYNAKLEVSAGTEPLTWTIDGDLPSGLSLTKESKSGRDYYVIAGEPEAYGDYPLTLTVSNEVGTATRNYNLQVSAIAPKIKAPSGFVRKYTVAVSQDFAIDIRGFTITGTKPLNIDIDAVGKALGLEYDSDNGVIKGNIKTAPSREINTVKLEVRNPYTESKEGKYVPIVYSFTLVVKSPPSSISPPYNEQTNDSSGYHQLAVPYYAHIGKNYKATFTANGGSKPVTWDFLIDKDYNGEYTYSVMQNGGKYAGLTFTNNGKISGIPRIEDIEANREVNAKYYIRFKAQASNEAGSVLSGVFTISFGTAPVLNNNTSEIIIGTFKFSLGGTRATKGYVYEI